MLLRRRGRRGGPHRKTREAWKSPGTGKDPPRRGQSSAPPPDMDNPSHIPNPQGFDEFMNVVIDETLQIYQPKKDGGKAVKESEELGRLLLKGEWSSWSWRCACLRWGWRRSWRRGGRYGAIGAGGMANARRGKARQQQDTGIGRGQKERTRPGRSTGRASSPRRLWWMSLEALRL